MPGPRAPQALDGLDPDELWAQQDAAARDRARRRAARRAAAAPTTRRRSRRLLRAIAPARGLWPLRRSRAGRALLGASAVLLAVTLAGLAALWPGHRPDGPPSQAFGGATVGARVLSTRTVPCAGPTAQRCARFTARLPDGRRTAVTLGPVGSVARVAASDRVRLQPTGAPAGQDAYGYAGFDRRAPLGWLAALFAVCVVALARRKGLLALAGFAVSLAIITRFLVPALLAGRPAILVALVGALAVMWVTLLLTYGLSPATLAAALGIAASLALACGLGALWGDLARLDGRSSELGTVLGQQSPGLSLQGIVLAAIVMGTLGVLADTGVTQASAVLALRRADPAMASRRLYAEAFSVGRDHLTATVHTLVLVYVGSALPLILVLANGRVTLADALNTQDLAEPIVATLVGGIALLASVPLTTALTTAFVTHAPASELSRAGHGHAH